MSQPYPKAEQYLYSREVVMQIGGTVYYITISLKFIQVEDNAKIWEEQES